MKIFVENGRALSNLLRLPHCSSYGIMSHSNIFIVSSVTESDRNNFVKCLKLCRDDYRSDLFTYNGLDFLCNRDAVSATCNGDKRIQKLFTYKNEDLINDKCSFEIDEYFSRLRTESLGRMVLFADVLISSYDLMLRLVELSNLDSRMIIISKSQLQGKGRSSNCWISPSGCAMFTCLIHIPVNSALGRSASIIQHVLAVSIIDGLNKLCQLNDGILQIKWPNDIYWIGHGKLCGIICKSSIQSSMFYHVLGCGINVSNSDPTVCVHDIIRSCSLQSSESSYFPSTEAVIASVMNCVETTIAQIQETGINAFKQKYYKYWMHKQQLVTVRNSDHNATGRIVGIDDYGYLLMKPDGEDSTVISLHPDGNSFDMMHNLIVPK